MTGQPTVKKRIQDALHQLKEQLHIFGRYLRRAITGQLDARGRRQLAVLCISIVVALLVCALVAVPLTRFISDPGNFRQLLDANYWMAALAYAAINTLHVFIAVIPGEPLELGAGALFGTWGGLIVVSLGLALGQLLTFLLVRVYGRRFVHLFVSQKTLDGLALFRDPRRRNVITFLIILIPGTPKDLMSYVCGLTNMRLGTWMAIATIARIPSILISTWCGSKFIEGSYGLSALIFLASLVLTCLGVMYYLHINRQAKISAAMDKLGRQEWKNAGARLNNAGPGTF